jgi:hypothetical protein
MDRLIIENVRCFRGRHEVPLAPLTLLVGENSTGKSTVLAMARLAWDLGLGKELDFNEEPFLLGAYDQIARAGLGEERVQSFGIGFQKVIFEAFSEGQPAQALVTADIGGYSGQPVLRQWRLALPPFHVEAQYALNESPVSLKARAPSASFELQADEFSFSSPINPSSVSAFLHDWAEDFSQDERKNLARFASAWVKQYGPRPYAFAPIRTNPQRTYDPIKEIANPQGGHVPMVLASLRFRSTKEWSHLKKALSDFGRASGLFEEVNVRRLGDSEADPFQLQVEIGGALINLIDVGYGVSQILPILVDCLRGESGRLFLLQQPEVHLHPIAQAELGSFMVALAKTQNKRFLIETHSDYLVDRIRMDIREKKHGLRPEDVAFLYFEREAGEVRIHHLNLDDQGDIVNAPPGYRKFILQEERRFLGI